MCQLTWFSYHPSWQGQRGGENPPHHNPVFIENSQSQHAIVPSLMILIPNKRTMKLQKGVCSSSGAGSRKDKPTSLLSAKASILIWSRSQKRVVSIKCSLTMRCHTAQLKRQTPKTKTLFFFFSQNNQNVFIKSSGKTHIVLFSFFFLYPTLIFWYFQIQGYLQYLLI